MITRICKHCKPLLPARPLRVASSTAFHGLWHHLLGLKQLQCSHWHHLGNTMDPNSKPTICLFFFIAPMYCDFLGIVYCWVYHTTKQHQISDEMGPPPTVHDHFSSGKITFDDIWSGEINVDKSHFWVHIWDPPPNSSDTPTQRGPPVHGCSAPPPPPPDPMPDVSENVVASLGTQGTDHCDVTFRVNLILVDFFGCSFWTHIHVRPGSWLTDDFFSIFHSFLHCNFCSLCPRANVLGRLANPLRRPGKNKYLSLTS
jgi:hypothetical protein